jgi:hypothetical protein
MVVIGSGFVARRRTVVTHKLTERGNKSTTTPLRILMLGAAPGGPRPPAVQDSRSRAATLIAKAAGAGWVR